MDEIQLDNEPSPPPKKVGKIKRIVKAGPQKAQPRKRYSQKMFDKVLPHSTVDKFHEHEKVSFSKSVDATTYTIEIIFIVVMLLAFINVITSNKIALITIHSIRAFILLLIVVLAVTMIALGYGVPDVSIYFYIFELVVVILITLVTLILQSIALHRKVHPNIKASADIISSAVPQSKVGDIIAVIVSSLLIVLNLYLLGVTGYRYYIGKRFTPLNTIITIFTAFAMAGTSLKSVVDAAKSP